MPNLLAAPRLPEMSALAVRAGLATSTRLNRRLLAVLGDGEQRLRQVAATVMGESEALNARLISRLRQSPEPAPALAKVLERSTRLTRDAVGPLLGRVGLAPAAKTAAAGATATTEVKTVSPPDSPSVSPSAKKSRSAPRTAQSATKKATATRTVVSKAPAKQAIKAVAPSAAAKQANPTTGATRRSATAAAGSRTRSRRANVG